MKITYSYLFICCALLLCLMGCQPQPSKDISPSTEKAIQDTLSTIAQKSRLAQQTLALADSLMHKKGDYQAAIKLCKDVFKINEIDSGFYEKARNLMREANLRVNYNDYNGIPISLFLEGKREEIFEQYPDSKIVPYIQYLRLSESEQQIGAYYQLLNDYPDATIPEFYFPTNEVLNSRLAVLTLYDIAITYDYSAIPNDSIISVYQQLTQQYSKPNDVQEVDIIVKANAGLMDLYRTVEPVDSLKVRGLAMKLLHEFPNVQFISNQKIMESQPEALLTLASFESDSSKAIEYYNQVIENYPESSLGIAETDASWSYVIKSIDEIVKHIGNPQQCIITLNQLYTKDSLNWLSKAHIRSLLAQNYEKSNDLSNALMTYQQNIGVFEKYADDRAWDFDTEAIENVKRIIEKVLYKPTELDSIVIEYEKIITSNQKFEASLFAQHRIATIYGEHSQQYDRALVEYHKLLDLANEEPENDYSNFYVNDAKRAIQQIEQEKTK